MFFVVFVIICITDSMRKDFVRGRGWPIVRCSSLLPCLWQRLISGRPKTNMEMISNLIASIRDFQGMNSESFVPWSRDDLISS